MATTKTKKAATPAATVDPITAALLNIGNVLENVTSRLAALESNRAAVAATPTAEVKRGRGRPKGSKNGGATVATVASVSGLPMPKFTMTRSEAENLATNHWRKFGDHNKNFRRSLRSAVKLCEDGGFDTLAELFAVRGAGKVNSTTGKGMPHYVAEAIAQLSADVKAS